MRYKYNILFTQFIVSYNAESEVKYNWIEGTIIFGNYFAELFMELIFVLKFIILAWCLCMHVRGEMSLKYYKLLHS